MTAPEGCQWRRDKDGLGVWEHRGKVAVLAVVVPAEAGTQGNCTFAALGSRFCGKDGNRSGPTLSVFAKGQLIAASIKSVPASTSSPASAMVRFMSV